MKLFKYTSQFCKQTIHILQFSILILLLFSFAVPSHATIFPVNAINDASDADLNDNICDDGSGNCTLRAAVEQANSKIGTDTIYLPAGTYILTIGYLNLNSDIYISGEGESATIIDGNHNSRIFFVASGDNVTLDSMKLQNGYIYEPTTGEHGGAIRNDGLLTVEDCTFFADTSAIGGAIYNQTTGDAIFRRCTFNNNSAIGWGAAHGGGIYNRGILKIIDSEIAENSCYSAGGSGNGGGISSSSAIDLTINNSIIRDNTISGILAFGGGIYNGNSPIKIFNSEISGNHTQSTNNNRSIGGGLYLQYNTGTRTDTIANTVIKENTVLSVGQWAGGGGIYYNVWNAAAVALVLDKVMIQGNSATNTTGSSGYGGGILCSGADTDLIIFNSIITGNLASGSSNAYGGGIRHRDGNIDILNSTISGNYANEGGGIYLHSGIMSLGNTILAGNDASSMGPDLFEVVAPTTNGGNLLGDNSSAPTFPSGSPNTNNDYAGTAESPIDPLLELAVDPTSAPNSGGDFHLQDGSIAIDNGLDVLVIGILATDIEGNDRRLDGDNDNTVQVDIGAYEKLFGPLPVELLEFSTICKDNFTHLFWTTSSETENQYFNLERSIDGQHWVNIGQVEGTGSTSQISSYIFDDFYPETYIGQSIYYRISQVDYNGKIYFLNIVEVYCDRAEEKYNVWPNPTSGYIQIEIDLHQVSDLSISLIDITGRILSTDHFTDIATGTIKQYDLTNYPAGIYLLNIQNGFELKSYRIIKK
jgi:type IX secretion system substrate protein